MRGVELLHPTVELLHPTAQKLANALVAKCGEQGVTILITDTLRTEKEQNDLYAQGRTKPGNKVTNLKYPDSLHCWGVAFDFAVLSDIDNDGDLDADWTSLNLYNKVGQIGKDLGLVWGGDFSNTDRPHFQLSNYTVSVLQKTYKTPQGFIDYYNSKVWNPTKEVEKLLENGIINTRHNAYVPITWGELATVLNKLDPKLFK